MYNQARSDLHHAASGHGNRPNGTYGDPLAGQRQGGGFQDHGWPRARVPVADARAFWDQLPPAFVRPRESNVRQAFGYPFELASRAPERTAPRRPRPAALFPHLRADPDSALPRTFRTRLICPSPRCDAPTPPSQTRGGHEYHVHLRPHAEGHCGERRVLVAGGGGSANNAGERERLGGVQQMAEARKSDVRGVAPGLGSTRGVILFVRRVLDGLGLRLRMIMACARA
jgi:hypothetical protein